VRDTALTRSGWCRQSHKESCTAREVERLLRGCAGGEGAMTLRDTTSCGCAIEYARRESMPTAPEECMEAHRRNKR